jgi:hypothetical protein
MTTKTKPETLLVEFEVCKDRQGLVCINNPLVFRPGSFWKDWEGWFIEPVDYDKLRAAQPKITCEDCCEAYERDSGADFRAGVKEGMAQGKKEADLKIAQFGRAIQSWIRRSDKQARIIKRLQEAQKQEGKK